MAHGDGQRAGARTRAAAHAGRAGGGAPWAGLDGHKPIQPAQWLYAGLEPGAQQLSCKQAALLAPAKSPAPHWSRKLRLSEKFRRCLRVRVSVSPCAARARHEARAMQGQSGAGGTPLTSLQPY